MRVAKEDSGQVLVVLALSTLVLILFVGLAVDAGMAYITKAKLSKAVDAACLTGMKALSQGQATATTLATHIFNANFGSNPPTPTITFPTDRYGDQQVSVTATAKVPTFFAQHFFQFWNVADTAVATRGKLVMALVLDRSGSMASSGTTQGGPSLKVAVPIFVSDWNNASDELAMISFASNATVDFHMASNFQTPINNAVSSLNFTGGTFGTGGSYVANNGPPLTLANQEITSVPIQPGQNVTRVAIYFTDGLMNTIQDTFTCYTSSTKSVTPLLNYGGYDPNTTEVDVFDPVAGTDWCPNQGYGSCINGGGSQIVYSSAGLACQNPWGTYVTKFNSQQYGSQTINRANVTAEAQYRAIRTANTMRGLTPGTFIYVIGLGHQVSTSVPTEAFLATLANDPSGPSKYTGAVYNSSLPDGLFLVVPDCPSTTCTSELTTAFQTIAAKILLRLTQ
jgi:Flp pilus assembly protein TadG